MGLLNKDQAVRAYLEGKTVQAELGRKWMTVGQFFWFDHYDTFRIKPEEVAVIKQLHISPDGGIRDRFRTPNLRLEWDADTHELIKAEIIK